MLKKYSLHLLILSTSLGLLTACQPLPKPVSPTEVKVTQANMKVKTRASSFVYLTPIPKEDRTVYISIQNDSGTDEFDAKPWLIKSLQEKSFIVVNNLDQANLVLRANILRAGKIQENKTQELLDSEFGNSTPILTLTPKPGATKPLPNNEAIVLDLQYFDRKELIDPIQTKPRDSMAHLTDIQLLLLCNTTHWERFETRIVSIVFGSPAPLEEKFNQLGQSAATANADIVRGLS
jgi:hypothetical protein